MVEGDPNLLLREKQPLVSNQTSHRDEVAKCEDERLSGVLVHSESRTISGHWVWKRLEDIRNSFHHVILGTKLNCLLLCIPVAIFMVHADYGKVGSLGPEVLSIHSENWRSQNKAYV